MKSIETHKNRIMDEIVRQCIPLSSDDLEPIGQIVLETLKQMESEKDNSTKEEPDVFSLAEDSLCRLRVAHSVLENVASENNATNVELLNGVGFILEDVMSSLVLITSNT